MAKKLVLTYVDSLRTDMLEQAVREGRAPNFAALLERGVLIPDCVSSFPSVTPVACAEMVTGVAADKHRISGMNWFNRLERRYVEYGSSLEATRSVGVFRALYDLVYNMNLAHLSPEVETLFERLDDAGLRTACTPFLIYRGRHRHEVSLDGLLRRAVDTTRLKFRHHTWGPGELFYGDLYASRETPCKSTSIPGNRDGYSACVAAELERAGDYDFLLLSLPDNDNYSHRHGPQASVESIAKADRSFGKLVEAGGGIDRFLDEHALILLADHAQTPVDRGLPLADLLGREWDVLAPSDDRPGQAQLAVSPTGRAAHVYLLPGEGERADPDEVRRRLEETEGIELVCCREDDAAVVWRDGRRLGFRPGGKVADLRGERWQLDGDPSVLEATDEDDTFRAPEYPDALFRVHAALNAPQAGDFVVSLAPGYEAVDWGGVSHAGGGSHGSLRAGDSLGPLLFVGCGPDDPGDRPQWTLRDVVPAVLRHFGTATRTLSLAVFLLLSCSTTATAAQVSETEALRAADREAKVVDQRQKNGGLTHSVAKVDGVWEVAYFADDNEVALVLVDPGSGEVTESWTGYQVLWKMARGYEGSFGHKLNAPYVFMPLCALFLVGLIDWRRPWRVATLDLVVLLGFGVSHYFFNRAEIGVSAPLVYPVPLYLLARALWIGLRGAGAGIRPVWRASWLLVAALFLIGFRVGLNMADSGVIDVGYAGAVGADRIAHGEPIYDNFPDDVAQGDTYGPVNYLAYVPSELIWPWQGEWDDLPAAHGAAVGFDLLAFALLIWLGLRIRPGPGGRKLAATLAFGWAAYPYTAYALESNSNDTLVAALLIAVLLALARPAARGVFAALSALTKFAPLVLAPMLAGYRPRPRTVAIFATAFAATAVLLLLWPALDPGLHTAYERTISYQSERDSPFSIWGQVDGIDPLRLAVLAGTALLAVAFAFRPRDKSLIQIAALSAALLILLQLTAQHWFYLYIVWFYPLLLVSMTGAAEIKRDRKPTRGSSSASI